MRLILPLLLNAAAIATPVDFVREVRPILEKHCYECHGERKQKSGLRLDVKAAAMKGGDKHGPDIVPGRALDSPLIHFLTTSDEDEIMPPKGKRLAAPDIAMLTRWVNEGAVWPDGVDRAKLEDRRDHWAFKPLRTSVGPHSIDQFIDAKLVEKGLQRSPAADPLAWLRRVSFDLTGLPPTPEEVGEFVSDGADKFTKAVNRLLASPRYGERWAMHWLDVVRYADTHGFEVNTERPNAWPYRDYVIRAFNKDTPYDRFIKEQIVGDAMGEDAATGFLVTASVLLPGQIGKDEPSKRLARQDSLDEIVNNIGQTFLGLSVGCARCHDHKFDPVTAKDYYAMQAFVAGVEYEDRDLRTPEAEAARQLASSLRSKLTTFDNQLAALQPRANSGAERGRINARENIDRVEPVTASRVRFTISETNNIEPCIDELEVFNSEGRNIALASAGARVTASGSKNSPNRHDLKFINDGRYGNSSSWMSSEMGKGWVVIQFDRPHRIERIVWGRDREGKFKDRLAIRYQIEVADEDASWRTIASSEDRQPFDPEEQEPAAFSVQGLGDEEKRRAEELLKTKRDLEAQLQSVSASQRVFAGKFRTPDEIHLLNRGDPEQPQERVVPAVLSSLGQVKLFNDTAEQQRRRVLADWIASPQNPLTARVMVNRIWQGHFGTGLVETPSDFGRSGMKPTHPELLDWLATEFIRGGWSVKHMHRLIVLSGAYRQSSAVTGSPGNADAASTDAEARYLWRFPNRRLEAEVLHDTILAVTGRLNFTMHGRGYDLFNQRGGLSGFTPVESFTSTNQRRMIYAHKVRREREAVFGAFDCPDAGQSTARRRESTTPIQALNLFNSRFTLVHAEAFAARVKREAGSDAASQIKRVYQLALNRAPTSGELNDSIPVVREHGVAVLCRAVFNSNEFLFAP